MRFDAVALREGMMAEQWPVLPCPVCNADSVELNPEEVSKSWTSKSESEREQHPDWDPEWVQGVFAAIAKCRLGSCGEPVSIAGEYAIKVLAGPVSRGPDYGEFLAPRGIEKAVPLVDVPSDTPESVTRAVHEAFALFWLDPDAAASRVRTAIEFLVDDAGRPNSVLTKNGGQKRLTLHERIEAWRIEETAKASSSRPLLDSLELLLAVKWRGNVGTHAGAKLSAAQVAEGFDLLGDALKLQFDDSLTQSLQAARRISAAKGR